MFLTGFLSSASIAVITSLVCLVMQKRRQPKDLMDAIPSPTSIYDEVTNNVVKREIVEITSNVASTSGE